MSETIQITGARAGQASGDPAQRRPRPEPNDLSYTAVESPLGPLVIAASDHGLRFAQFGADEAQLFERLGTRYPRARLQRVPGTEAGGRFAAWITALCDYLQGATAVLDLPVDVPGTPFQHQVWDHLRAIPRGELRTYKQVATELGRPTALRAVGRAIGSNPVAVVIPCHRIVRTGGALGDYRWGPERKRALIELERRASG